MDSDINVKPLSHKTRKITFLFLVLVFLTSLPFLYMYATGYRFDISRPTNLVSTGGIYIAVERTGAEIYIDGELMRETRTFRKAFYAQGLPSGTHRVHVQKEGFHTWVKELPVSKRLVTEAEAFNLPVVPQVRIISEWKTATGTMVVPHEIKNASTTNEVIATTTPTNKKKHPFVVNDEFISLRDAFFGTSSTSTVQGNTAQQIRDIFVKTGTTTQNDVTATTTIQRNGVRLYESEDDVYATWEGSFEQMPYYYCAPDFPPFSTSTPSTTEEVVQIDEEPIVEEEFVMHPVQTLPQDLECDPTIRIDRKWQQVHQFDFFPGSDDLVILVLEDGVYVVEIDDRSWQNVQPLFVGEHLQMHINNGNIYLFDGTLIYQVLLTTE